MGSPSSWLSSSAVSRSSADRSDGKERPIATSSVSQCSVLRALRRLTHLGAGPDGRTRCTGRVYESAAAV